MKRSSHDLQMVVESYDVFNLHCIRQLKKIIIHGQGSVKLTEPTNIPNCQLQNSYFPTSKYVVQSLLYCHPFNYM